MNGFVAKGRWTGPAPLTKATLDSILAQNVPQGTFEAVAGQGGSFAMELGCVDHESAGVRAAYLPGVGVVDIRCRICMAPVAPIKVAVE